MIEEFARIKRLPPYVFNIVNELKATARARGEDIIDFGMGNPDQATPQHIVEKLVEAAQRPDTHRYSLSRGIPRLRKAICDWYGRRYNVDLDYDRHAIVTIGSKEGLAHLALATMGPGDAVLVPNPAYPIHPYGFAIAGADKVWHWADAVIDGATVVVSSAEVKTPVAVRYAWDDDPRANLVNGAGLPAGPFRTDSWP